MVDNLCATTITVLFLITSSIASCIKYSDSESREDVASSKTNILLFSKIALAIATLCLSHPESLIHLSQTKVSYHLLKFWIKSWHLAILAAAIISSSLAFGFQYAIFSLIDLWNNTVSCGTIDI
jgi:hypothetical protein